MAQLIYEGLFDSGKTIIVQDGVRKVVEFLNIEEFNRRKIVYDNKKLNGEDKLVSFRLQKLKSGVVRIYSLITTDDGEQYRSRYYSKINLSDNMILELQMKGIIKLVDESEEK